MGVHLKGPFNMTKAAQKHFVEQKYGKILNLSSVSALGNRGQANYSAAKMGVQGFTRTLGIELGPFGINANAIAPGFIATEMTDATAARVKMGVEDFRAAARRVQPGPPGRIPRGHRRRRGLPVQRRGVLHHRPDAVRRRRRQARLTPPTGFRRSRPPSRGETLLTPKPAFHAQHRPTRPQSRVGWLDLWARWCLTSSTSLRHIGGAATNRIAIPGNAESCPPELDPRVTKIGQEWGTHRFHCRPQRSPARADGSG